MSSFLDLMFSTLPYFSLMSRKLPLASGTNSFSQMSSALDQIRSKLSVSQEVNCVAWMRGKK